MPKKVYDRQPRYDPADPPKQIHVRCAKCGAPVQVWNYSYGVVLCRAHGPQSVAEGRAAKGDV